MIAKNTIYIQNIYYMLAYAFTNLRKEDIADISKEDFENIHNLFASILAKGISQQIKRGLFREYINKYEDLSILRGKINMQGTIKNRLMKKSKLSCEYDELSENNLLNQIVKTTVFILLRHANVKNKYKEELRKNMLFFSNVESIQPSMIDWSSITFQRNYKSYRMMIMVCQLILEGMLISEKKGDYKLANFIDERQMHYLFEKFVLEYYIKEHPYLKVNVSQIQWVIDNNNYNMLPNMQSDIMIEKDNKILIIDTKFWANTTQIRNYSDIHTIHSSNLYQIFTYVKNKTASFKQDIHEVSGILLYAKTEELIQPDETYIMSGNKISVKTLNLNCHFNEISKQLDSIIKEHFFLRKSKNNKIR